jgi:hypothetical protein
VLDLSLWGRGLHLQKRRKSWLQRCIVSKNRGNRRRRAISPPLPPSHPALLRRRPPRLSRLSSPCCVAAKSFLQEALAPFPTIFWLHHPSFLQFAVADDHLLDNCRPAECAPKLLPQVTLFRLLNRHLIEQQEEGPLHLLYDLDYLILGNI